MCGVLHFDTTQESMGEELSMLNSGKSLPNREALYAVTKLAY
jgi:hypothetical protein